MLPNQFFNGTLVEDPAFTHKDGQPRLEFRMVAEDKRRDADGTVLRRKERFTTVILTRKAAMVAKDALRKGDEIVVFGRLSTNWVEANNGRHRMHVQIHANRVYVAPHRRARSAMSAPADFVGQSNA
jgi:single-stranded DNA-binding protein